MSVRQCLESGFHSISTPVVTVETIKQIRNIRSSRSDTRLHWLRAAIFFWQLTICSVWQSKVSQTRSRKLPNISSALCRRETQTSWSTSSSVDRWSNSDPLMTFTLRRASSWWRVRYLFLIIDLLCPSTNWCTCAGAVGSGMCRGTTSGTSSSLGRSFGRTWGDSKLSSLLSYTVQMH